MADQKQLKFLEYFKYLGLHHNKLFKMCTEIKPRIATAEEAFKKKTLAI